MVWEFSLSDLDCCTEFTRLRLLAPGPGGTSADEVTPLFLLVE